MYCNVCNVTKQVSVSRDVTFNEQPQHAAPLVESIAETEISFGKMNFEEQNGELEEEERPHPGQTVKENNVAQPGSNHAEPAHEQHNL